MVLLCQLEVNASRPVDYSQDPDHGPGVRPGVEVGAEQMEGAVTGLRHLHPGHPLPARPQPTALHCTALH